MKHGVINYSGPRDETIDALVEAAKAVYGSTSRRVVALCVGFYGGGLDEI